MQTKLNTKVYVGHLPFNTTEEELTKLFAHFDGIIKIDIPTETTSDRELGYAVIEFSSEEAAQKAIAKMNGKEFKGRQLKVNTYKHSRCRGRW